MAIEGNDSTDRDLRPLQMSIVPVPALGIIALRDSAEVENREKPRPTGKPCASFRLSSRTDSSIPEISFRWYYDFARHRLARSLGASPAASSGDEEDGHRREDEYPDRLPFDKDPDHLRFHIRTPYLRPVIAPFATPQAPPPLAIERVYRIPGKCPIDSR